MRQILYSAASYKTLRSSSEWSFEHPLNVGRRELCSHLPLPEWTRSGSQLDPSLRYLPFYQPLTYHLNFQVIHLLHQTISSTPPLTYRDFERSDNETPNQ